MNTMRNPGTAHAHQRPDVGAAPVGTRHSMEDARQAAQHGGGTMSARSRARDGTVAGFIKRHPLASFFGLTFFVSWALMVVLRAYLQATGMPVSLTQAGPVALLLMAVADAVPSAVGIVLTLVVGGTRGVRELFGRLNPRRAGANWYAAAILTNPVVVTVVLVALAATVSPDFLPPVFKDPTLMVAALPFALFIGLTAGTNEEFGWTGFALPRLLARSRAFSAALTLGLIWAFWHVLIILWVWPAVRSPNLALLVGGGLIWCAALVPYRILMSWVYVNTQASLLSAIVMHAFYDATLAALTAAIVAPVQIAQLYAALGVALGIAVALVVAVFGAERLSRGTGRRPAPAAPTPGPAPAR
jgi:membrane protease YdiL (CAAX protease family)